MRIRTARVLLAAVLCAVVLVTTPADRATAAGINDLSVVGSNAKVGTTGTYTITLSTSTTAIACVSMAFSSNSDGTGTSPVALSASSDAPAGTFMNWTGWAGSQSSGTGGAVVQRWIKNTGTAAPANATAATLIVNGTTNAPKSGRYFLTVRTYSNNNCSTSVDSGTAVIGLIGTSFPSAGSVWGQGGSYTTGTSGLTSSTFNGAKAVAIDSVHHRLFVADSNNNRILIFNLTSNNTFLDSTADYVLGQINYTSNGTSWAASAANGPCSLAWDADSERLYVVNFGVVFVWELGGGITSGMAATYVLGSNTGFASAGSGLSQNQLNIARGVAYDYKSKLLWVADSDNRRVVAFDTRNLSSGMNASYVLGQPDFTTRSGGVSATKMTDPWAVAVDPAAGRLYVAESWTGRVLVFDTSSVTNGMAATKALGQPNMNWAGGSTTQNTMSSPRGLTVAGGKLWVADTANARILGYDTATIETGGPALYLIGQSNFTTGTTGVTATALNTPMGLIVEPMTMTMFVSDSNNHRVLTFKPVVESNVTTLSAFVVPSLTMTVSGHIGSCNGVGNNGSSSAMGVSFGHLNIDGTSAAQDVKVTTDATGGYTVYLRHVDQFKSTTHDFTPVSGSNAAPVAFPASATEAYGYTTSDTTLGTGVAGRFSGSEARYAATSSSNGEVAYAGGPVTDDTNCVGYRAQVAHVTPPGTYASTVMYTAVASF